MPVYLQLCFPTTCRALPSGFSRQTFGAHTGPSSQSSAHAVLFCGNGWLDLTVSGKDILFTYRGMGFVNKNEGLQSAF